MPGVIQMAVREQHPVELLLRRGGRPVQGFGFLAALEESAIDEHVRFFGLNVISRAGDTEFEILDTEPPSFSVSDVGHIM